MIAQDSDSPHGALVENMRGKGEDICKGHRFFKGDALKKLDSVQDQSCRLAVTSPPYNIGKEYERDQKKSLSEYLDWFGPIIEKLAKKITQDGSVCWQVGNYVKDGEVFPLDFFFYEKFSDVGFKLRNRIIWHFNFGLHATNRFSGRYETLLWFTKSDEYHISIDPVRVPQLYPGKRHAKSKGAKAGTPSGNPKGKNPGDFWTFHPKAAFVSEPLWDVPNVKANHCEKTFHPCQFPSELAERCILALTKPGDWVLDPFVGAGTSVIAAAKHGRLGIGIDKNADYIDLAKTRLREFTKGHLDIRPLGKPVHKPRARDKVAQLPPEWIPKAAE